MGSTGVAQGGGNTHYNVSCGQNTAANISREEGQMLPGQAAAGR